MIINVKTKNIYSGRCLVCQVSSLQEIDSSVYVYMCQLSKNKKGIILKKKNSTMLLLIFAYLKLSIMI